MADGTAIVRITALPDAGLNRALSRVVTQARRASQAAEKAGQASVAGRKAEVAATRQAYRESERANRTESRRLAAKAELIRRVEGRQKQAAAAERQMARDAERITRDLARTRIRESERSARARIRDEQRVRRAIMQAARDERRESERSARRASERRRGMLVGAAGAAYGAARAGVELVGRGQRVAGVGTLEERIEVAGEFRKQMILTANEAKVSAEERKKIEADVLRASRETNVSILDLSAGLQAAQTNFDAFREFAGIIDDLARVSAGKDIPIEDLINVLGAAKTGLGIEGADEQRRFLDMMIATAERGSIEPRLFAQEIGPFLAQYAEQTDRRGIVAAGEVMSVVQALGKFQPGQAGEIKTQLEALLFSFREKDTEAALRQSGVEIYDRGPNGEKRLRGLADIAQQMATSEAFQRKVRTVGDGGIFGRKEAVRAATFLMTAAREDPKVFTNLQNISAGEGLASADRGLAALKSDPMFALQSIGVEAQAKAAEDLDQIVSTMKPWVEKLTEVQTEFPLLTEATSALESTMKWAVGAIIADRLMRGGFANRGFGGGGMPGVGAGADPVVSQLRGAAGSARAFRLATDGATKSFQGLTTQALPAFAAALAGYQVGQEIKPFLAEVMGADELTADGYDKAMMEGAWGFLDKLLGETPRQLERGVDGLLTSKSELKIEVEDKRVRARIVRAGEGTELDLYTIGGNGPLAPGMQ